MANYPGGNSNRRTKHPPEVLHRLYALQDGECVACRRHFAFRNLGVDHIVPLFHDGLDAESNLQLLCNRCNAVKGTRGMDYLVERLREEGLYKEKPSGPRLSPGAVQAKAERRRILKRGYSRKHRARKKAGLIPSAKGDKEA